MDYRKEYIELIKKAKSENRVLTTCKWHKHHILPKSLFPLWAKRKSNIVLLTVEEHIRAHELLAEIYPCWQMWNALRYLKREMPFELMSKASKELWKNEEYRKKVTDGNIKYWTNEENLNKHSEIVKAAVNKPEISKKRNENGRKQTAQSVRNIETGKEFESCTEAAIWAGVSKSSSVHIGECCRNEREFCGKTPEGKRASWEYVGLAPRTQRNVKIQIKEKPTNKRTWWHKGNESTVSSVCPGEGWEKGRV